LHAEEVLEYAAEARVLMRIYNRWEKIYTVHTVWVLEPRSNKADDNPTRFKGPGHAMRRAVPAATVVDEEARAAYSSELGKHNFIV